MKTPIYIREIKAEEREEIEAGLRSSNAFVMRRSQIILASERKEHATAIARNLGCDDQTVRNVIKEFNEKGIGVLEQKSRRPHRTMAAYQGEEKERLKEMIRQSPRQYGKETSLWTLALLAEVSYEQKLTKERVSDETVRATLVRLGIKWKRAKHWINSPDPAYERKKSSENA
jgi:transposase